MKKLYIAVIIVFIITFLSACQPTPENTVVVGKNQDTMLSAAAQKDNSLTIFEQVNAPSEYYTDISTGNSKLNIKVDAYVTIPDEKIMPVLCVKATDFTQEQADGIITALFNGETIYDVIEETTTKQEIKDKIVYWKEQKQSDTYANDPDGQAFIDNEIAKLEKEYQTAPDEDPSVITVSNGKLKQQEMVNDETGEHIAYYTGLNITSAYGDNEQSASLSIVNNNDLDQPYQYNDSGGGIFLKRNAMLVYNNLGDAYSSNFGQNTPIQVNENTIITDSKILEKLKTTPAEAKLLVEKMLIKAGINYMKVCSIYLVSDENLGSYDGIVSPAEHYAYRIQCVRMVDNIPCSYVVGQSIRNSEDTQYSLFWNYETMVVLVNDRGIIQLDWRSPLEVTETLIEDSALLPFSQIADKFEQRIQETYEPQASQKGVTNITINISRISLELQRITKQNSNENGLLVPVWNFYGTEVTMIDGEKTEIGTGEPTSFLTINAIDNSVIYASRGY